MAKRGEPPRWGSMRSRHRGSYRLRDGGNYSTILHMDKDKPHLTLVDPSYSVEHDAEFTPLPYFPWDERPCTLPLDADECATAVHLEHGDVDRAARLLKVSTIRLQRMIRSSPRLQRILDESLNVALARAVSIPIRTLFDPEADHRRLEWASTKLLQSRLAQGHPLSPAPAAATQANAALTVNPAQRTITFRWRTDDDPDPNAA